MYDFVVGPLAWLSFSIFFVGLLARFFWYVKGLNWQIDRVSYKVNIFYGLKGAFRSIFYWLLPFGTRGWRFYPGFTILVFVFHCGLILVPVFLLSHNILLYEKFGISFWSMPESFSNFMTVGVIVSSLLIIMRRFALPEVRIITGFGDFLILAVAVAPFITGLLAYYQFGNYDFWILLHVVSGEIMLILIPFSKLSHFILFFLSRAQIGMDYGIKRGGMKNNGLAW